MNILIMMLQLFYLLAPREIMVSHQESIYTLFYVIKLSLIITITNPLNMSVVRAKVTIKTSLTDECNLTVGTRVGG